MPQTANTPFETREAFEAFYLKRLTTELAEDLDKVRNADDFKADSVPFLVQALKQGARQYDSHEQSRIVSAINAPTRS